MLCSGGSAKSALNSTGAKIIAPSFLFGNLKTEKKNISTKTT